jgi:hypothetical protein
MRRKKPFSATPFDQLNVILQFIPNHFSIIPHFLQLSHDHAHVLLCKVIGTVPRQSYLYVVFAEERVPSLLPWQFVEPVAQQPRDKRFYGNFFRHRDTLYHGCPSAKIIRLNVRNASPVRTPLHVRQPGRRSDFVSLAADQVLMAFLILPSPERVMS